MNHTSKSSKNQPSKPATQSLGISIWDFPPPVPVIFDKHMFYVLEGLRSGDPTLLADMIESGRLDYASRFMTTEDNARLAKALRNTKPKDFLSKAENRTNLEAEKKRDARLLGLACFWYAQGYKTTNSRNQDSIFQKAVDSYSLHPVPGAYHKTAHSIKSHLWKEHLAGETYAGDDSVVEILNYFVKGLKEASPIIEEANERFLWFGKHFLKRIPPPTSNITRMLEAARCPHRCRQSRLLRIQAHAGSRARQPPTTLNLRFKARESGQKLVPYPKLLLWFH